MALPTSGALSLDAIHVEAGGTTNTTVSFNDTDIRGLTAAAGKTINSTLGTQIDFNNFYGASSVSILFTTTLTSGGSSTVAFGLTIRHRGFNSSSFWGTGIGQYGSLSDDTDSNVFSGNEIISINNVWFQTPQVPTLYVSCSQTPNTLSNNDSSAFASIEINGTSYNRSAATYSKHPSANYHRWSWSSGTSTTVTNDTDAVAPFPASGNTCTVNFT
jgi:hypothetical protein